MTRPYPTSPTEAMLAGLRSSVLLSGFTDDLAGGVVAEFEWLVVDAGEVLIEQGERSDALYVLTTGTLEVWIDGTPIEDIRPGETAGEMSLLTDEAPGATVRARRESVVASLSRARFLSLVEKRPEALLGVSRMLVERLRRSRSSERRPPEARWIAILAGPDTRWFTTELVRALGEFGRVLHLDAAAVDRALGEGTAAAEPGTPRHTALTEWLELREAEHQHLVLEAAGAPSPWLRRAVTHADATLMVAKSEASTTVMKALEPAGVDAPGRRELVLIRPPGTQPSRTRRWLEAVAPDRHHHVREGSTSDVGRVARTLDDRSTSLTLGGGAARAFAHLGALRALADAGIAIDALYGTSIGALIGAASAMGTPLRRITTLLREHFVDRSIFDLTVPLISAATGERFDTLLGELFGDADIEDLQLPFACVSCDLVTASAVILDRGRVSEAVRASSALTGIFPPVVEGDRVLVDGGLLENLPMGLAHARSPGRQIVVNVVPVEDAVVRSQQGERQSRWAALTSRLNPLTSGVRPTILELGVRSFFLPAVVHAAETRREADLYIEPEVQPFGFLEMSSFDPIVEAGYVATLRSVDRWRRARASEPTKAGAVSRA